MNVERAELQPTITKYKAEEDGIALVFMHVHHKHTIVPQHSHSYSHLTAILSGRVRVMLDGEEKGEYSAPSFLRIPARTKHLFVTLEDDTVIECIHNVSRSGDIEITEEHQIVGDS